MRKSWKTSIGGILLAIGQALMAQSDPWWLWKVGSIMSPIGAALLGLSARDNNVPSSAVPSAAKADEKIKGDTKPPFAQGTA
jgi:hypothetical protein